MAVITDQVCELRVTGLPACAVLTTSRDPQWGPFGVPWTFKNRVIKRAANSFKGPLPVIRPLTSITDK